MGSPRTVEILEALKWLSLTPGERRKTRPPDLTPLSEVETEAFREALEAVEMGIDVPFSLGMDALAEDTIRSDDDRKRGRLADIDGTPVLDLLRSARGIPLHSFRIRDRFLDWLATCDSRDARNALALLKRDAGPFSNREHLGIAVLERVDYLRAAGFLESEAVQRVAEQGAPWPAELVGVESTVEALGSRALPPMSIGLVRSLLRDGKRAYLIPRKLARHKRPSASKRAATSSAVYSDPKPAETSPLSTLPSRQSTGAGRERYDDLPNDNRSGRPTQAEAANPPGVEAQRQGAAILQAVRKPRALRGRGADAVPRGSDVRSHGRGDDSTRKRPGSVKEPP